MSFTKCISSIYNTQIDNAEDIFVVKPMYNLIEFNGNYSNTSGRLWEFYRDGLIDNIAEPESFKSKIQILKYHELILKLGLVQLGLKNV